MAKAKNQVIAGYHNMGMVTTEFLKDNLIVKPIIGESVEISKSTVDDYELITEEKIRSGTSTILRGAVGAAILGPVGILAGLTGKKHGINTVAIQWSNGEKSLLEIDDKLYKLLVRRLF